LPSTETLSSALEVATAAPEARTVKQLIDGMKPELERSLQDERAAEVILRHFYNATRANPLLLQCTGESLVGALLLSAQVRLEPGPLGHVYLVPFKNRGVFEVTWILGYTGIIELGRRGGAVGLAANVVREGDVYERP
jgi:recombination protein RecT